MVGHAAFHQSAASSFERTKRGDGSRVLSAQSFPHRFVHLHPFGQRRAAFVTRAQARLATVTVAGGAETANQALAENEADDGRDGKTVGTHHQQAFEHPATGAGVEGGNDEMPRQGGAHGDIGGFLVADFAKDKDLRVLTQQVACRLRKGQATSVVDFRLHHAGDDLLDGVFDGNDVASAQFEEIAEAGVNRGGFAAAAGPVSNIRPEVWRRNDSSSAQIGFGKANSCRVGAVKSPKRRRTIFSPVTVG